MTDSTDFDQLTERQQNILRSLPGDGDTIVTYPNFEDKWVRDEHYECLKLVEKGWLECVGQARIDLSFTYRRIRPLP
jgi:hypothetical protein